MQDRFFETPAEKGEKGDTGLAGCNDRILRSGPEPREQGCCWRGAARECTGHRNARMEGNRLRKVSPSFVGKTETGCSFITGVAADPLGMKPVCNSYVGISDRVSSCEIRT